MTDRRELPIVAPGIDDFAREGARPAGGWETPERPQVRLVPTHCCFCGVQCGMYLKVDARGRVFGVEARDHDINRMRLCPKGVVAYQQVNHPDRLLRPLMRDRRGEPLRPVSWDAALDRIASKIRRIQEAHGRDAFGVIGGASLTNEKHTSLASSPAWRFARVTSTTTAGSAWSRRGRTRRPSGSIARPTPGPTCSSPR